MKPIREERWEKLPVAVYESNAAMGAAAAEEAKKILNETIAEKGEANLILAAANSQLSILEALRSLPGVDWGKVNVFHMDEYVDIPTDHPASFPLFLKVNFLNFLKVKRFYPIVGDSQSLRRTMDTYESELRSHPADLCILGIGENGHIAFNDPPFADFYDPFWVKKVRLDEKSRKQQVGEGHFPSLDSVPVSAVTLTIPALRAAKRMLCIVPESRKADAVFRTKYDAISDMCPATFLRETPWCTLYLDQDSAAKIL